MNIPKWLVIALIAVIIICLLLTVWALFFRIPANTPLTPDYAPVEKEENAENIEGDDDTKLTASPGGGAVGIIYSDKITIDLSDKKASLYFANPGKSLQDMVLQVVIQDEILVQTGTINPGKQVRTLNLLVGKESLLTEGVYEGKLMAHYYNTETGEKAMVSTAISVTITVRI
ncbi:MAG: hypothetical protein IJX55_08820 [Clostridia bacterium]|nr:hypothetical protein [Clostridia bacterium]